MDVALIPKQHDTEELYQLFRSAMEPYVNAARGTPWNDDRERTQFLSQLAPESLQLILFEGQLVGFLDMRADGESCFLHTMIVAPERQSQGIGSAVLEHLKSKAQRVSLRVLKTNSRARSFYLRGGFHDISSTEHHYHMEWASNHALNTDAVRSQRAG
jgi:ribosomal protein S18 acetylase RimI-like enzyme